MELAERVAGDVDVNAILSKLTPRQFEEWIAYRSLYGDPLERIIETLKVGFAAVCHAWGAKVTPDDFEVIEARKHERDCITTTATIAAKLTPILGIPRRANNRRRSRR